MTAHADYNDFILSLNPLAYWTFQGLAPGALHDWSGNGHDLAITGGVTLNHSTPLDGFMSARLDGSTGYLTPAGAGLHTAQFTVLGICYPQTGPGHLFNTESSAALNVSGFGAFVGDSGHNFGFGSRLEFAGGNETLVTSQAFGAYGTGYVQLAVSYDGVNQLVIVNGTVVAALPAASFVPGATQAQIGRAAYSASVFFNGFLSDLALFDYPLQQANIAQSAAAAGLQTPLSAPQVIGLLNTITTDLNLILASVRKTY